LNPSAPQRPVDYTEETLVTAILDGTYPPGATLPGERDLAALLGVTRPTLREVLRRLERDGWLTIHQGKSTAVNDVWREGGLNILSTVVRYRKHLPARFYLQLLEARCALAPAFMAAAVRRDPHAAAAILDGYDNLPDEPLAYAEFDWRVQHRMTIASGNPIYTLIFNGFAQLYLEAARRYFSQPDARAASHAFYATLHEAARRGDPDRVEAIVREAMQESIALWIRLNGSANLEEGHS